VDAVRVRPGDLILIRGTSAISRSVWLLQCLRRIARRQPPHLYGLSHVALVSSPPGRLVEVMAGRVRPSQLDRYRDVGYHHVQIDGRRDQRLAAVRWLESRVDRTSRLRSLVTVSVAAVTRGRWCRAAWPRHNCAALVAQALTEGGAAFSGDPQYMLPSDLGAHYGVTATGG
jgi:hypothetical protein